MISFRYRSNQKKIKIKTNKRLDQRMSSWLQKVFNIKSQIIGFKSADNKYYDVQTFFMLIDKFYNTQVQIVEGNDQVQISFTSDNLNSSSFIRPSQPNTSQLNHKGGSSDDEDVFFVSDLKSFQKKLNDGRDVTVLFDIHPGYKKEIIQNLGDLTHPYVGVKTAVYLLINNSNAKKSNFSIYIGKKCVVVIPLTVQYKEIILNAINRSKAAPTSLQPNKALKPQIQDEAPSFTTHHLQQRLNQDACNDYLQRMSRQKLLTSYEFHKLMQKLEDNFADFYKIFCDSVVDNDYQSFKNEVRMKVQNNLQMLLSNVEEMDLSRPISRQEQRRQNIKKTTPDIEIVKVQNYFEVLDLIKDKLDPKYLGQIKQNLLDQNQQLCSYFSKFIARDFGKDQLSRKLTSFAKQRFEDLRPFSRCVPRSNNRAKSTQGIVKQGFKDQLQIQMSARQNFQYQNNNERIEEAPMFGSVTIQPESIVSPIKNMSDIESIYKLAWDRLAKKSDHFAPEEYGLLYHYLQTKNDGILNIIHSLEDYGEASLAKLKQFLKQKIIAIMNQNFTQSELSYLETIKNNQNVSYIFQNFKYQCDINAFLSAIREELNKGKPQVQRILHKKSSDSQLLQKPVKSKENRKYSDQNKQQPGRSPSPKASDMSLYQKGSEFSLYNLRLLSSPWEEQFEEMLNYCQFRQSHKIEYLRTAYAEYNPSLFLWVRQYLKNKETKQHSAEYFRQHIQKKQYEQKGILKILPIYSELLRQLQNQGKITFKMRKWAVFSFMELSLPLLASFQLYLLQSKTALILEDEQELVQSIKMVFQQQNKQMQFYKLFSTRIEELLKEMSVHDKATLDIFKYQSQKIKSFIEVYFFSGNFDDLMENLDLLHTQYVQKSKINIATLNFSGINTNPFEYDDGSEIFKQINANIKELINSEVAGLKDWKLGKIDKNYTDSNRLSVGFNYNMNSIEGKLLNQQQFERLWRQKFNHSQVHSKFQPSQEQIAVAIKMDSIFYRALIKYVYNIQSFEKLQSNLKSYDANILNQFLVKQFNRPASKLNIKQDLVIQYLLHQKIDVLCLQQAGFIDWKQQLIPGYGQHKNHDSVIIYNKQKLGHILQDLTDKYAKELDFNSDTSFIFTNKNYLLISSHLKSKAINIQQAKEMFAVLRKIKSQYPLLKILIGMDANHLIHHENLLDEEGVQRFFLTPDTQDKPTSIKQRSFMQAQYKKAGVAVSEVKDHIVSSEKMFESTIEKVNGEVSAQELLPNDIHPYDHYIVRAKVNFL